MNIERTSLEKRAATHAALADPARLQIIDLLTLADRSPGELQVALGLTSNLVAHHLGVLDRTELIVRSRSEGDRRRSYIRLRPSALDGLLPTPVLAARRVVFVCTGNSARSPLAAALWAQASPIPATSAGTHPAAATSSKAIAAAERHDLPFGPHTPRDLGGVIGEGDLVVTVCDRAHEELVYADALHWSVPNPGRVGTDAAYDATFDEIARRIARLSPQLSAV
ncbi:helix-turn-helix domain-containing protein [Leucobacter weissii]|uniref:Helix-turn-helix domain-containing protein n=2 Tax=Leucobacter weissii TaxID=1983706 RepID=A0A939MJ16_9MICO|nr:helix-turn-helix domain-containing protein [Leucobacter weissii]MBO1901844.1 helix-turn-helix domain-containing protein [Leucobacter weissii]